MTTEYERLKKIIEDLNKGNKVGEKLRFDPYTKTIRTEGTPKDPDDYIKITPDDANLFNSAHLENGSCESNHGMITISEEIIQKSKNNGGGNYLFSYWKDSDAYTLFNKNNSGKRVPGIIHFCDLSKNIAVDKIGKQKDRVRIIAYFEKNDKKNESTVPNTLIIKGYIKRKKKWVEVPLQVVPVKEHLYSRIKGLYETDILSPKKIFIAGLGSGGSYIALELTKSGAMMMIMMDHDRFEVANTSRHVLGISHSGRYKTLGMAQVIKDKNPYAEVTTHEEKISWDNYEKVSRIIRESDITICATDDRVSKQIINRASVEQNKPCIFAGAFRRAYGGQVLNVRPHVTPCYQCLLMMLPDMAKDREISSSEQAERIAYSDRPVPIEPGLSIDIAPISVMVVKLVIQELLKGAETTLRSLDDDFVAPLYLWLNRREIGTQYEKLEPLEFNVGGMHVLRWYGIDMKRDPSCPVCGDFEKFLTQKSENEILLGNFHSLLQKDLQEKNQ